MKPLLHTYLTVTPDMTPAQIEDTRATLTAYADREGYALGHILEARPGNDILAALIDLARAGDAAAILVRSSTDLGRITRVQQLTRQRIERDTGRPVLIVEPTA